MQTLIIIVSQLVLFGPNQDTLTFFGTDENWEPKKYDQIWEVLCFTARKPGWNHIILLHPFSCASKSLELECGVWKSSEAFPQPVAATLRASPKCVQTSWHLIFFLLQSKKRDHVIPMVWYIIFWVGWSLGGKFAILNSSTPALATGLQCWIYFGSIWMSCWNCQRWKTYHISSCWRWQTQG